MRGKIRSSILKGLTPFSPATVGPTPRGPTLGGFNEGRQPCKGCTPSFYEKGFNPFRVVGLAGSDPRVARSSQPWADGSNPVGIGPTTVHHVEHHEVFC